MSDQTTHNLHQGSLLRRSSLLHRGSLWLCGCLLTVLCFSLLLQPVNIAQAAPLAQAPLPEDDSVEMDEDTVILIDVLANDSETNGSPLTLSEVGAPRIGTAEIVDNKIRYTPKPNFFGRDSFFYTVHNGDLTKTRQAAVSVVIKGSNDAPTQILLRNSILAQPHQHH